MYTLHRISDHGMCHFTVPNHGIDLSYSCDQIIQMGLIENFSPQDAKKISNLARLNGLQTARLGGKSMWVPMSRLKYLPFFVLVIGMALAFAIPMATKRISVFGFEVSASLMIFPWVYIFTDCTNELFGYQMTKRCIRYIAFILIVIAVLIQISLLFKEGDTISATLFSDASSDDIIRGFDAIYTGLPQTILIYAFGLLAADTFNAYLFTQLKEYMHGKKLWLRSLCSSCFASIGYIISFGIAYHLCRWEWPSPHTGMSFSLIIYSLIGNLVYFIIALPLLYIIRNYIHGQEAKTLAEMGNADFLDDETLRAAERKGYWH